METYGYCGKILHVDLTTREVKTRALDMTIAKKFIGDFGINVRLGYDLIKSGIDAFSPENVIIIGAGPFVGTGVQAARCTILTKMPLTGAIAIGSGGMGFATQLKRAGYDHVIITGRADKPVYLKIFNEDIEVCDASHLWGKDIVQTSDELWEKHGKKYSIISIGQAGENLVRISLALIDSMSTVGKGGLAAVMGSKNLKAIVAGGTKKVKISDPTRFKAINRRILKAFNDDSGRKGWIELSKMTVDNTLGPWFPVKNWTEICPIGDDDERFGVKAYLERIKKVRLGCPGCSYPCKDIVEIREGEFKGLTSKASCLGGSTLTFGYQCGVDTFERVVKCSDLSNRYGIEYWNLTSNMQLIIELYERGIITDKDIEGLPLKTDFENAIELIEKTTFRKGIGDVLADGALGIINKFGKECERYSVHIKGLDQQFDPRIYHFNTFSWCQAVNPQGGEVETGHAGTHFQWGHFKYQAEALIEEVKEYCQRRSIPKEAVNRILMPTGYNVGRLTRYVEDFYSLVTSFGICEYRTDYFDYEKFAELYSAATGINISPGEVQEAGERIWNMYKALNVREGFSRKDDRFPPRWLEPLKTADGEELPLIDCTGEVVTADKLENSLDDYYNERGWDTKRGIPSKEKLTSLGLTDVARDFEELGMLK